MCVKKAVIILIFILFLGVSFFSFTKQNYAKEIDFYKEALNSQDVYVDYYAAASVDGKWGFVNKKNKFVVKPKYQLAQNIEGDYFFVCKDKKGQKCAYMNKKSKKLLTGFKYLGCGNSDISEGFSEGMAKIVIVNAKGEWKTGYINQEGKEVITPVYSYGGSFSEGLANVEITVGKESKMGYINKLGKVVIPAAYSYASPFKDGIAKVRFKKGVSEPLFTIDKSGQVIKP